MSNAAKRIVLVNGSPKPNKEESASEVMLHMQEGLAKLAGYDTDMINVRSSIVKGNTEKDFEQMCQADAIIFTFPLYVFCLPGILMRYLQDYHQFLKQRNGLTKLVKIYAVVNCGFTEPEINEEAIRVIQSFSRQIGAKFGFGVSIGGGGMLLGAAGAPFMKKTVEEVKQAFDRILKDIDNSHVEKLPTIQIPVNVPRRLYYFFADRGWIDSAKKNKLKKKDLYRKPYYNK